MLLSSLSKEGQLSVSALEFLKKNNIRTTVGLKQHYRKNNTFMNLSGSNSQLHTELLLVLQECGELDMHSNSGTKSYLIRDLPVCFY
jgi:hypothetical protein